MPISWKVFMVYMVCILWWCTTVRLFWLWRITVLGELRQTRPEGDLYIWYIHYHDAQLLRNAVNQHLRKMITVLGQPRQKPPEEELSGVYILSWCTRPRFENAVHQHLGMERVDMCGLSLTYTQVEVIPLGRRTEAALSRNKDEL